MGAAYWGLWNRAAGPGSEEQHPSSQAPGGQVVLPWQRPLAGCRFASGPSRPAAHSESSLGAAAGCLSFFKLFTTTRRRSRRTAQDGRPAPLALNNAIAWFDRRAAGATYTRLPLTLTTSRSRPREGGANSRARWPQNTRPSSGSRRRCWEAGRPKTRGPTTSPTACWPACTVRQAAAACRRAAKAAGAAPGRWASPHCPAACLNTHPTRPPPPPF